MILPDIDRVAGKECGLHEGLKIDSEERYEISKQG